VRSETLARDAVQFSASSAGLHPGAWLAWLVAVSVAAFLTSNPLYLSLALLASASVYASVRHTAKARALAPFVYLGLVFAALSIPFNVLTGSSGPSVLASAPTLTFPRWLGGVTFGGDITAEALVAATSRAITIATLVLAAAAFNAAVDHFRLLRLAPRALSQVMLSLTIALLVVPEATARARAVAEAQRLRGRRARGLRAVPSLLLPTLQGALERAVQRAESLEARGFGANASAANAPLVAIGVAGLGLALWGAFAHFYYGAGVASTVAMAAGAAGICVTLVRVGSPPAGRLRSDKWSAFDVLVAASAAMSIALVISLRLTGGGDADYLPYPEVVAPAFHPAGAAAFVLLLLPVGAGWLQSEEPL
jgi:energy-coupling factor transport system permease protein